MAQQKMLVAVCLFGLVAIASAQMNFDLQSCSRAVRLEADRYRESLTRAAQKFTQSLQEAGNSAVDTSVFQQDLDKLTQSLAQMADVSQGVDMSRLMSSYLENLQTISRLLTSSIRLSLFQGAIRNYFEFGSEVYTLNTQFLDRITQNCLPEGRRLVLPAQ